MCAPLDSNFEGIEVKGIQNMQFWYFRREGVKRMLR